MYEITCIVVDDERKARDLIESFTNDIPNVKLLGKAPGVDEAIDLVKLYNPDIVFLDIQMPNKDGFEFVREIRTLGNMCHIVFVTAHDEYAIKAIKSSAFDYLLKPINPIEIKEVFERFRNEKQDYNIEKMVESLLSRLDNDKRTKWKTRTGQIWIDPKDIIYCEADGNYSKIYKSGGRSDLICVNLGALFNGLPDNMFYRSSRSYIINLTYLVKINRKKSECNLIKDGDEYIIPVPSTQIRILERLNF